MAQNSQAVNCYPCGQKGHASNSCPTPSDFAAINSVVEEFEVHAMSDKFLSDSDIAAAYEREKECFGTCPICSEAHEYDRNIAGETVNWPSSQLRSCNMWMGMDVREKAKNIK